MHTTLRALHYVVAAADTGSVSKAADLLNVSQPSVSGAIAALEADLKLALFVRHHARGISLTPAGRTIVEDARALLAQAEAFDRKARSFGTLTDVEITVGCFTTLASRYMPDLLSRFAENHPGIRVTLRDGDQSEVLADLLSGKTEFALSYGYALPDEILSEPLGRLPPYLMLAATHPLAAEGRVSLKRMAGEPFVLLDLPYSRDYFMAIFSACGVTPNIAFRSRSTELVRGLVAHGQGYSIMNVMPRTTTTQDGREIAILAIAEAPMPVEIMGLRLRRHPSRPAVESFAAVLREAFGPGGLLEVARA